MRISVLALSVAIGALAQGSAVAEGTPRGSALHLAHLQQETSLSGQTWSDEQQCLMLARRLVARTGPHKSANVAHDDLKALSDEICAE